MDRDIEKRGEMKERNTQRSQRRKEKMEMRGKER